MNNSFPKLETERLVLRQSTKDDCKEVLFLRSDSIINQYVKRQALKNIKDAEKFLQRITREFNEGKIIYWTITLKENPKMIGSICLWNFSSDKKVAELGYDLNPTFQGKGIMTESLKSILKFAYEELNLSKIEAFTHKENKKSKSLLEKNHFIYIENRKDEGNKNNIIYEHTNL